jgi:hypothetical protein
MRFLALAERIPVSEKQKPEGDESKNDYNLYHILTIRHPRDKVNPYPHLFSLFLIKIWQKSLDEFPGMGYGSN